VSKQRRLGRGLEALLGRMSAPIEVPDSAQAPMPVQPFRTDAGDQPPTFPPPADPAPMTPSEAPDSTEADIGQARLDMQRIDSNPSQPRQDFDPDEMRSLAASISDHGLLQPVVVRRVEDRYELIAGERRLRAARQAGWTELPANIVEADDRQTAELAIVENLQRRDLNPLEKAASFQRYLEQYGCTQEELAQRLKLDRSTIANLIRLLELPGPVQEAIRRRRITQGHARALLPLGDEREQIEFSERIQRERLNVRQTETLVQETIEAADAAPLSIVDGSGRRARTPRPKSEHLLALEQELRAALGMKVKVTHNARGRGKLTIHFRSHEEFERLRRQLTDPGRLDVRVG